MADKKVTIEVQDAVVDGKHKGERLQVSEETAKHLERIGYAKAVEEQKETKQEAPKKSTKKKTESKQEEPKEESGDN